MPKLYGENYRIVRLCVDEYENGEMRGRYYHPAMDNDCARFQSLTQFLVGMERIMDTISFPQSFTGKRSFASLPDDRPEGEARLGRRATFSIRLMFRQNASWQGAVTWLESNGEQTFRSVLELILLLDSALGGC